MILRLANAAADEALPLHDARWPDGFLTWDEGRLRLRPDMAPVFARWGWNTVADVLACARSKVIRRVADRDNCVIDDHGEPGFARWYLKRHWTRGLWRSMLADAPGWHEANAVGWCQAARVPVMKVAAAGAARLPNGAIGSFFLSDELDRSRPADDFWNAEFAIGKPREHDGSAQRNFLAALADTAARFHQAGLFHRDFYWCHFFVREAKPGQFTARLIDLQRVLRRPVLGQRWRIKDLAQFFFSAPPLHPDFGLADWLQRYVGRPTPSAADRLLLAAVQCRAMFYRWKDSP